MEPSDDSRRFSNINEMSSEQLDQFSRAIYDLLTPIMPKDSIFVIAVNGVTGKVNDENKLTLTSNMNPSLDRRDGLTMAQWVLENGIKAIREAIERIEQKERFEAIKPT